MLKRLLRESQTYEQDPHCGTQAMEAERTRVNVARERAVVVHQEAQTEHKRAVMMVPSSTAALLTMSAQYALHA